MATDGKLSITPVGLFYQLPASTVAWKLSFSSIREAARLPPEKSSVFSFGSGGGSVFIRSKLFGAEKCTWICQVCEELNETTGDEQAKCLVCGCIQKGALQVIQLDTPKQPLRSSSPWECDVCQEVNESSTQKCQACGFSCPATEHTNLPNEQDEQVEFDVLLQFTKGGSSVFIERLQPFLSNRKEIEQASEEVVVGIAGLLRREEARGRATEETLTGAFSDLDALMQRAGVMVKLAAQLSSKLNGDSELKRLISGLQLDSSIKTTSASTFSLSIAKSIEQICLKLGKNTYSLADVYLLYNRSLGSDFVSPADLRRGAEEMSANGMKFVLFSFKRGGTLCLVHRELSGDGLRGKLLEALKSAESEFLTPLKWSQTCSLTLQLATEQLEMANQKGWLVCDSKRPDLTPAYYLNLIN